MSTQKKTIDEIWKELNTRPTGRSGTMGTVLGGSSNLPGVTTLSRTLPAKPDSSHAASQPASAAPAAAVAAAVASASVPMELGPDSRRPTSHYDPARAGVAPEEVQAFVSSIQRTINCMSDPDRNSRKQAISTLYTRLAKGGAGSPPPSPAMLQALICGPLLYPVVTLLSDTAEATRIAAAELLQYAAATVPDFSAVLPVLMPEVVKRMGHLPVVEPAEEARLLLAGLVTAILQRWVGGWGPSLREHACVEGGEEIVVTGVVSQSTGLTWKADAHVRKGVFRCSVVSQLCTSPLGPPQEPRRQLSCFVP